MMKLELGDFGSAKMEAFVEKVYQAMNSKDDPLWQTFTVDMTRRDAMDMAAKAERDAAVEQARDSIREQMTPEIRDQARREALTEVCSFATRAFR